MKARRGTGASALRLMLTAWLAMISCGCQLTDVASPSKLFKDEPDFVTPTKVIPVWSDTVLHQVGKQGQRGCGGRVMFYAGDGKKAVQVDGSLVVYVWDDSSDDKQRKPDRKYVFRAEDFQKHYSASTIGESYSFWIPWDGTGGEQTELTLVARFIGRNGAELTSTPGKVILPGEVPTLAEKEKIRRSRRSETWHHDPDDKDGGIRQVSFEQGSSKPAAPAKKPSLTTAEIPLTDGFLQRNMQRPAGFSTEELFKPANPGSTNQPQGASPGLEHTNTADETGASARRLMGTPAPPPSSVNQNLNGAPLPADRSLQFRHRVQTSRAARRSVGHALSERYRTESRPAPWERD